MSSLPESTKNQNIEIEISTLNSSGEISSDDKILINNELKSLRITHELSEKTLEGVCAGDDIKRLFVIEVEIKGNAYSEKLLRILSTCIKQKLLMVIVVNSQYRLAIVDDRIICSSFCKSFDEVFPELHGTNIDEVYANLIADLAHFEIKDQVDPVKAVRINQECFKLEQEIERLELKCLKESQPRRKMEIYEQVEAKRKDLSTLKASLAQ